MKNPTLQLSSALQTAPRSGGIQLSASALLALCLLFAFAAIAHAQQTAPFEWTWMGGSSAVGGSGGNPGVYGTLGTPAAGNVPGGRTGQSSWTDNSGNLWLFGGGGMDSKGEYGILNDLWEFNPATKQWTWKSGCSTIPEWEFNSSAWVGGCGTIPGSEVMDGWGNGQLGVYGTLGVPAAGNVPGSRFDATSWTDSLGNLWLFGGFGYDANGNWSELNDLWLFGTDGKWEWMGGSSTIVTNNIGGDIMTRGQPGVYGALGTPSTENIPGGRAGASSWTDSSGNFWLFGGYGYDANGNFGYLNDLWKIYPYTFKRAWMGGSSTVPQTANNNGGISGVYGRLGVPAAANFPGSRCFASSWTDKKGNLWLFGGQGYDANGNWGLLNDLWEFNPSTNLWTWVGGSSTVPAGGSTTDPIDFGNPGAYGTLGTPAYGNIPGSRYAAVNWTDSSGNFWLFGGVGYDANGNSGSLNDLWEYQPNAITPFLQVNGAAWQEATTTYVYDGATVNLGPWPQSGGTWSWTGPNGFTSTSREIDNIPLSFNFNTYSGLNTFVATYTNAAGVASTETFNITMYPQSTPIIPYLQINGAAWQWNSLATVPYGSTVNLGPWPLSGGSWSWTGPNGFTSTSREIDNIPLIAGTNYFEAWYTNPAGATSYQLFEIVVTGAPNLITPYIEVNGVWNATPESTVTVAAGSVVSLGPWPASGGSWYWTGPNGFASTLREIDNIPLSVGANTYTATYTVGGASYTQAFTVTVATPSCGTTNPIVPYIAENGVWNATPESAVTVAAGTDVSLGPWPVSGGTWYWTEQPNGFTSNAREIDNIALSEGTNVYIAAYTDPNACVYTQLFTVAVQ